MVEKRRYRSYKKGGPLRCRCNTQRSSNKPFEPLGSRNSQRKLLRGALAIGLGAWALGTVINNYKEVK